MTATTFVDTNVLLYAASNAPADQDKRAIARRVLAEPNIGFSAQVLQEFYAVAVTKRRLEMNHEEAVAVIESLTAFPVCPITRDVILAAIATRHKFQISYWDAAILVAAQSMGCDTIYSEDFNDGQLYDTLRVVNPFAHGSRSSP